MQVLELYFNPKKKADSIYDSFCFEPESVYEKRLGSLYIVSELANASPKNSRLLEELSETTKARYYSMAARPPATALREGLKSANKFLAELVREGNVEWLGNLDYALLSLKQSQIKGKTLFVFNFTKVGQLKILLMRKGVIMEIGKELEILDIEPYPLKVFSSTASGKLQLGDRLIVVTRDLFLHHYGLIERIAALPSFDEKQLREVFQDNKKDPETLFGVCFVAVLTEESKSPAALTFQEKLPTLPSRLLARARRLGSIKYIKYIKGLAAIKRPAKKRRLKIKQTDIPEPKVRWPVRLKKLKIFSTKKLLPVPLLLLVLFIGFLVFKNERGKDAHQAQAILQQTEERIAKAKNLLTLKETASANRLLQEAWTIILPQTKAGAILSEQAARMQETIEKELNSLNNLEDIKNPKPLFEFQPSQTKLIPQKMVFFDPFLYFFNPASNNLYRFDTVQKKGEILVAPERLTMGAVLKNGLVFFSRAAAAEGQTFLLAYMDGSWSPKNISPPSASFSYDAMTAFMSAGGSSSVYFLDCQTGDIAKYIYLGNAGWQGPLSWLKKTTKRFCSSAMATGQFITADGSLWFLTKENSVDRYYSGTIQETLRPSFFPFLERPTKIYTAAKNPWLYILEPSKKRLVVLAKNNEIVKQFQSDEFNNLLDFAVSDDGSTIWLLNGSELFQLEVKQQ